MSGADKQKRPSLSKRSVLITGGAGFIGSHLADRLVETCEVTILDDLSGGSREHVPAQAELIEADIRDETIVKRALDDVDTVFHLAARVSVSDSIERPIETHEVNLDAALNLLEFAPADTEIVLASSTAIYGEPSSLPVTETDHKEPASPYGLDKLSADHFFRLYSDLYDTETTVLRYFNVYGSRQRSGQYGGVVSIFVDQALSGGPITVHGDGTQTRDFIHVDDIVDANIHAANADISGEAFNIGTGTEISILELAETVRRVADVDVEIVHEPARSGDVERSRSDFSKAKRELGFSPTVSLEEGIERLVAQRE
jgi:UDP-glucose 4-epimerase